MIASARLNTRGLTIIELMISLAISSLVIVSLLGVTSTHLGLANQSSSRLSLNTDLLFLSDFFSREILNSGGEYLPVFAAIFVENNCAVRAPFPACQGADRLTLMKPVDFNSCSIVATSGATLTLEPTNCCLNSINAMHAHVMVTQNNDFADKWVTSVNPAACTVTVTPGPYAFRDSVPTNHDWSLGNLTPVNMVTYYLDQTTTELIRHTYTNNSASMTDATDSPLADRVMDFQIALGFDFDPTDGVITDNGNATDEWLYNNPAGGEALGAGVFASVTLASLRMVNLGLVLGYPQAGAAVQHSAQLLDGPLKRDPNIMMGQAQSKLLLRSLRDFQ